MEAIVEKEVTLVGSHNLYFIQSSIEGELHAQFKTLDTWCLLLFPTIFTKE
jgi:hypothetical protein